MIVRNVECTFLLAPMSNLINRSKTVLLVAPLVKFMAEEALRFDVWLV